MSLAARTREAVAAYPFLRTALRAEVVNYTAAARFLDVEGETEAVATALRRYAADLPEYGERSRDVRVTMESGVGPVDDPGDALLSVGGTALGPAGGDGTAVVATGEVDARALAAVLERLDGADVAVDAAAVGDGALVVAVDRLAGADAVRAVEGALAAVPVDSDTS